MDGTPTERRGGPPSGLRRLRANEPSKTITASAVNEFLHPSVDRFLTLRECARLQTFPDEFDFIGTKREQALLVGNSVPPLLAEAFGRLLFHDCRNAQQGKNVFPKGQTRDISSNFVQWHESHPERDYGSRQKEIRPGQTRRGQRLSHYSMLSQNQKSILERARALGGGKQGIALTDDQCAGLIAIVVRDLDLADSFPDLPLQTKSFYDIPSASLAVSSHDLLETFELLLSLNRDADTYFQCLANTPTRAASSTKELYRHNPFQRWIRLVPGLFYSTE